MLEVTVQGVDTLNFDVSIISRMRPLCSLPEFKSTPHYRYC